MLFKNKKLETKQKIAIATAAIFALVSFLPSVFVITGQTEAQSRNDAIKETNEKDGQEIAGSIILTKKPDKIADVAKGKGLETEFVQEQEKGKPSIVAVKELPGDGRIKDLEKRADVEDVLPNYVYRTKFTPNDTNYSAQWNMDKISAPVAWDITRGSSDVTIAVIDTGVLFSQTINGTTYTQPDFPSSRQWTNPGETGTTPEGEDKRTNDIDDDGNGLVDDWRGWDFMGGFRGNSAACPNFDDPARYEGSDSYVTQDNDPQPYACDSPSSPSILNKNDYDGNCVAWTSACYVGHGTMVASVAAAASNNSQLVAGIDHNGKIMNMRVIDGYGYTTTAHIVSAIDYAVEKGADVINMSLGMACDNNNFTDTAMENALSAAASAGVVTAAASGNESETSSICYPASSQYVMAVGATDQNDNRHSYSNYSNKLDVVAPAGVPVANAPSAFINSNYYASAGGTSLATPHVAGLAALLKSTWSDLSENQIEGLIKDGTDKVAGMKGKSYASEYGYGRINIYKTLSLNINWGAGSDQALVGDWDGDGRDDIGLKRGSSYFFDTNGDGVTDIGFSFGRDTDKPFVGDWDGDGEDNIGLRRGKQYFFDFNHTSGAEAAFSYGRLTDKVIYGDWDNDNRDDIGLRRDKHYYFTFVLNSGSDADFVFGRHTDIDLIGDWDGDGKDEVGLRRGKQYFISYDLASGSEVSFSFGRDTDLEFIGDWDNDNRDEIGLRRGKQFFLSSNLNAGADITFSFGRHTDRLLIGDWDDDGSDEIGLRRGKYYFMDYDNASGAETFYSFGL